MSKRGKSRFSRISMTKRSGWQKFHPSDECDRRVVELGRSAEDGLNLFARDVATIDRLIMQVRKQGYAFNEGHLLPGVSAIAFPLFERAKTLAAVLAMMGRHERINPRDGAKMVAYLKRATRNFSP
jgi:DNA-binding IclR family transcriptional regulator